MPDNSPFGRTVALIETKTTELEHSVQARDLNRVTTLIAEIDQLVKQLEHDDTGEPDA